MSQSFKYRGPAAIDGVQFPVVLLQEDTGPGESLQSWSGMSSFRAADAPEGFTGNLGDGQPVKIELPEGRSAQVLIQNTQFDGQSWTVYLQGTGPTPA
ncbi:hypothetical protein OHB41_21010 [Streptomyces sp. NBC_01571]|uniref:hypothetical protein n=1 Tax=Streptomyces sp. NBC_01571 TaxID=2975883 RepID=UPI002251207D|nr:hypothetical protein [Streptomyces sp. NBC_01571]MCX4575624.1 hypothetical protein [Streptomyces sp. NBC_01571]